MSFLLKHTHTHIINVYVMSIEKDLKQYTQILNGVYFWVKVRLEGWPLFYLIDFCIALILIIIVSYYYNFKKQL